MALLCSGKFRLASGLESEFKIDCDYLTTSDWSTVANFAIDRLPYFSEVEGVPSGGLALANALRRLLPKDRVPGALLIVDDVLTTGKSMERIRDGRDAIGFVLFARSQPPPWVQAMFLLTL